MMRARRISVIVGSVLLAATHASAAPTPRDAYASALAKERTLRAALTSAAAPSIVLRDARALVGSFQTIARQYPSTVYADDALWHGGRLSVDLFVRFRQSQDRTVAVRMLHLLTTAHPRSRLVKRVPAELARMDAARAKPPAEASPRATDAVHPGDTPVSGTRVLLRAIRRTVLSDTVRITIDLDGEVSFRDERVAGPSRLAIDLPLTKPVPTLVDRTVRFDGDGNVARQVRIGQQADGTVRLIIDATGVASYSIYPLYSPYRLVVDCIRGPEPPPPPAPLLASRVQSLDWGRTLPSQSAQSTAEIVSALVPPVPPRLTSRRYRIDWALSLPAVSPSAATLITQALVPPELQVRRIRTEWARTLPDAAPASAALIADALLVKLPVASSRPRLALRKVGSDWGRTLPSVSPRETWLIRSAVDEMVVPPLMAGSLESGPTAPLPAQATEAAPALPRRTTNGYSMARQLGLGVSRIVIDPGHGGHDPGAQGTSIDEAGLVLDVALRVEKLLQATPGTEVILTRRSDEFVPLAERTAIANRENADLFLSIHANASAVMSARGVETYFLNFAENMSAASVAARENAASGQSMGALPDLVRSIALNNKLDESRDFAFQVQRAMIDSLRGANKTVRDLGVKQAPFAVLIGAAMPSVLAEISFVTNAQEERLLRSTAYRQRIAEALYSAVRNYQLSLVNVGTRHAVGNSE
jgi:N-acetylmuramoyl-L-alanine amidase